MRTPRATSVRKDVRFADGAKAVRTRECRRVRNVKTDRHVYGQIMISLMQQRLIREEDEPEFEAFPARHRHLPAHHHGAESRFSSGLQEVSRPKLMPHQPSFV